MVHLRSRAISCIPNLGHSKENVLVKMKKAIAGLKSPKSLDFNNVLIFLNHPLRTGLSPTVDRPTQGILRVPCIHNDVIFQCRRWAVLKDDESLRRLVMRGSSLVISPRITHQIRPFTSVSKVMGRENIVHYQLERDHETDLTTSPPNGKVLEPPKPPSSDRTNFPFTLLKESTISDYLENNRFFVESIRHNHLNQVFELNGKGQSPHTLWIGCSDSRAGESCLSTLPGEIFTHRNIANIVNANDISSQGVIQFAVDVLKVRKIIVCGHTDCGGVWASLSKKKIGGVLDLWLNPLRHIRAQNVKLLELLKHDPKARAKRLAELNVVASVMALKRHPLAQAALKKGEIEVWGLMYDVGLGFLLEVEIPLDEFEDAFDVGDEDIEDDGSGH